MPLNIKDPATEKSVRELAAVTGETVTAAVRRAAEDVCSAFGASMPGVALPLKSSKSAGDAPHCLILTGGVRTRFSVMTKRGCRPDRHRHLCPPRGAVERGERGGDGPGHRGWLTAPSVGGESAGSDIERVTLA
jgi:hypothetical protein